MSIYLWSQELDPKTIGWDDIEAIYVWADEVWSAWPSTKRLALEIETDWVPSSDWEWVNYNTGDRISYIDMPVDYKVIWLTWNSWDIFDFIPADGSRNLDSSLRFNANIMWGQWAVFSGIKYIPYGWTAFNVDLTQPYQESIPMGETWELLQGWDKMVMVFETQSVPTFTVVNTWNYNDMNNALASATGVQNFTCWANKILLWSDWYCYYATTAAESWRPASFKNCYAKISKTWAEWTPVYTVEDYYLETAPSDNSSFCNYFQQGNSYYIPPIASYVWDPSIVDVQSLWEYIYNKLQ